ncbi:bifunctional phosphoribosylaminoimidazolecarboxamide formyltransferase/IMP cyclohydrolase [Cumulibacter soli]|uniref:bifunctional phosphoribosylaminoimidazolecarboxamide formyltransferase/IMP cyclohydrolase n=1 Tax=Cumulibacter soli TaxID=2546344 RepID=UPI0010681F83|nr:bifunctional phosphoribosylaminoimidazolecarboxamide formyltransferase/IMP cyclohydrolase [Cumulibacter soli]
MDKIEIKRALVSVYDKSGLPELAAGLKAAGVQIVSTGSTAKILKEAGADVTEVAELTGFPECLDGRVKTLHPKVHAGILADRRLDSHVSQLAELEVEPFDLVICNLYPFTQTVASGASPDECVEQIDIGGPSMVRAAAKNHPSVAVVTSPQQYGELVEAITGGGFTLEQRKRLAAKAFAHTAAYDAAVSTWFAQQYAPADDSGFPDFMANAYERADVLRYGENPHQQAAVYLSEGPGIAHAQVLHGKAMSYNNYVDADAARRAAYDFEQPAVAIIKHANPCGIAVAQDIAEAHRKAHACDPLSAYGGVIAANRPVSVEMAETVSGIFTEVLIAPGYEDGALEILQAKKNIRLLQLDQVAGRTTELRPISGGALVQQLDAIDAPGDDASAWTLAAGTPADADTLADLQFAWRSVRAVKSNAILLASGGATIGVGMGQVNRVDSAKLAVNRAGDRVAGTVAASDAFFPFADGFEVLASAGVKAVVQPGGSVRDDEVVEAAKKAGVTMYFTGTRHFFH